MSSMMMPSIMLQTSTGIEVLRCMALPPVDRPASRMEAIAVPMGLQLARSAATMPLHA